VVEVSKDSLPFYKWVGRNVQPATPGQMYHYWKQT